MAENVPRTPTQPIAVRPTGMKIETPQGQARIESIRANHANLSVLSPVNQNGSYEFDRVIKAGTVQWKPIYLVLRPNLLSIYRDKDETKLRHKITLSDLTAVARQKDSKKKMAHVFGLFSPARNYRLGAATEKDAQEWVDLIRMEARIDAEDEDMIVMSPLGDKTTFSGFGRAAGRDHIASSSSEAEQAQRPSSSVSRDQMRSARRLSHTLNYSGNEHGSFSDFSDTGGALHAALHGSTTSLPHTSQDPKRSFSQVSSLGAMPDNERVVYHGWLYVLKSKGGVRQWKKVWVVLRPKTLGLYKNEEEYSANLIVPFSNIIDAVDIDPVSRTKKYCMQIISEEKNFRFCASNEDSLSKWLGAFKSLLAKRKDAEHHRVLQAGANSANPLSTTSS
ncbi:hypothetical protein K491DRAFT_707043 [Lophiostoma macrostomum CBS 122681]|uniref:PH domain-containing protein n=1 Tax=Lophiostoma macrostomum CBS 122681 TaxID=1314788 RepID=A0A6A6SXW7_9PLEO|nr:hypothetical protein K491DRAFT_707043 [Lophiostoma macrostomum CBS 122681]